MTDSKIYIIIKRNDKYYVYKSTEEINWPPSGELVSDFEFILATIDHDRENTKRALAVLQIFRPLFER